MVYQLWFMGIPMVAQALKKDFIKRQEARLIVNQCQDLRKAGYIKDTLSMVSKNEAVKQIARSTLDNLKHKDILILSLLARYFDSSDGIPSRDLILFAAYPFHRLKYVISRLHNLEVVRKNWSSLEEFQKSVNNVLAGIEYEVFKGKLAEFLHG